MEFYRLNLKADVEPLKTALETTTLWDKHPFRRLGDSPHREMVDIWARFNDLQPYLNGKDFRGINDEHDSIWYYSELTPLVKEIAYKIMAYVNGERLGGILITKLPPNGQIYPHSDHSWHAHYYQKYYVCIKDAGSKFIFNNGEIKPQEGDIWWFDNSKTHSVINTDKERIAMIVCIKTDGVPCLL